MLKFNPYKAATLPDGIPGETTPVLVAYVIGRGWQLTTLNDGCIYTPQSYEANFGILPPYPKGKYGKKARKEWRKHRRVFKGFAHNQKPQTLRVKGRGEG